MQKSTSFIRNIYNANQNVSNFACYYSSRSAVRLTKEAAKDLSNDGTGKHPHVMENYCILKQCEKKKCPSLCNQGDKSEIKGHNTHKPPVGRMARFINDSDAHNDPKPQYFVPVNEKREITAQEKEQYGKNIKDDVKQTTFIQQHDDKYNN